MDKPRLRIAFVTDETGMGGGETSLLNTVLALRATGDAIPTIIGAGGWLEEKCSAAGIPFIRVHLGGVRIRCGILPALSWRGIRALYRHAASFDVLHAETVTGLLYCGVVGRLRRMPVVATCHGFWPLQRKLSKRAYRLLCRSIYSVSEAVTRDLLDRLGHDSPKIVRLPLSVSRTFAEIASTQGEARTALAVGTDVKVLVHIARFQRVKGHDILFEAFRIVHATTEYRPFLFFVGGVEVNAEADAAVFHQEIRDAVERAGLENFVRFVGRANEQEVARLMRAADVCLSPSRYESFGMCTVEAMIVGTPVIATRVGGTPDLISHGITGTLVPPESPEQLASAIIESFAHPQRAQEMALRAREAAMFRFGPSIRAACLINEYCELLGQPPARGAGN